MALALVWAVGTEPPPLMAGRGLADAPPAVVDHEEGNPDIAVGHVRAPPDDLSTVLIAPRTERPCFIPLPKRFIMLDIHPLASIPSSDGCGDPCRSIPSHNVSLFEASISVHLDGCGFRYDLW